jgi:hypothetical protein
LFVETLFVLFLLQERDKAKRVVQELCTGFSMLVTNFLHGFYQPTASQIGAGIQGGQQEDSEGDDTDQEHFSEEDRDGAEDEEEEPLDEGAEDGADGEEKEAPCVNYHVNYIQWDILPSFTFYMHFYAFN